MKGGLIAVLALLHVSQTKGFSNKNGFGCMSQDLSVNEQMVRKQRCSLVTTSVRKFLCVAGVTTWFLFANPVMAKDFSNKDISNQDFSGQDLRGMDFTRVVATNTIFHECNLQGSNFNDGVLNNADFSGANVQGASFKDSVLDGANFKDALAERAVFTSTILDVGSFENADLTKTIWPSKYRIMICDMDSVKGTNGKTGANTYESLMCIDYYRNS